MSATVVLTKQDFQAWMKEHKPYLKPYTAYEIARLAISCGFALHDVTPDVSDWIAHSRRLLTFWESSFREQWVSLRMCDNGFEWED